MTRKDCLDCALKGVCTSYPCSLYGERITTLLEKCNLCGKMVPGEQLSVVVYKGRQGYAKVRICPRCRGGVK